MVGGLEGYRDTGSSVQKNVEISQRRFISFLLDSFMDIVMVMEFKANYFFFFFVVAGIEYEIMK